MRAASRPLSFLFLHFREPEEVEMSSGNGKPIYLETSDVARVLRLSKEAVRLAANDGRLEVEAKTAGGLLLFRADTVAAYKEHRRPRGRRRSAA
jgi:hypothetical protein